MYCVHIVLQNTFAAIELGYEYKDRDIFGGMGRFKLLRCKGFVNSVIINVITEINLKKVQCKNNVCKQ